ncbi:type I polyketide synthase [Streptomyces sp. NPDC047315]|uniref:type I polyketide synthase n=1 Tax=Streptomyces sp. NPDC047315 TaxID=3155142 RepID=UPI0033C1DE8E
MTNEEKLREYLRRVTVELGQTRTRLREVEAADSEPLAIVGMACRFPGGVESPEDLWRLADEGGDAISELPDDRGWNLEDLFHPDPDHVGTSYVREGGFVQRVGEFDAELFGISPREALAMDPQQRVLLESAWEVFERAGIDARTLRGSRTGVFVGAWPAGYAAEADVPEEVEGYTLTGGALSILSGRLSYVFGLEGPAVTVDTACSSSLVALHWAGQALRRGDCTLALVGGVSIMSTPVEFIGFSRQRGLAADGRCKAFSAAADGMGLSEGVGTLLVERLSDARRNGHRVLAVIRGSAVNQDGASNGITAPNDLAQMRVIRQALANAGLTPSEIDVVEAHGTGTSLGDPIEAQALLATYGQDRDAAEPLWLGSVKSNIGHTQAAAGMAGIIKMVLALRSGRLPKTLHVDEASPHIDWEAGAVRLLTEAREWPAGTTPRRAAVSSFGISGTNAHVIVEEATAAGTDAVSDEDTGPANDAASDEDTDEVAEPAVAAVAAAPGGPLPWIVSGKTESALVAQAERLAAFVAERPELSAADVSAALLTTRTLLERRAVVLGTDRDELLTRLRELAAGRGGPGTAEGTARRGGRTVFVFPGQGAQWAGMGADLLAGSPVFAAAVAECETALAPHVDWSLTAVLTGADGAPGLDRVDVVQPASFAVMVSLARLWQAHGITPDAVLGHSQGEIAAAVVAGALSLQDGARLVALRSRAITALAGHGAMASIALDRTEVERRLEEWGGRVSLAAVNGPQATVVSGEPAAVEAVVARCEREGVRARRIAVDYASHSPHVESLREQLADIAADVTPLPASIVFCSTVEGASLDTTGLDAAYWYRNLREPVEFEAATRTLLDQGCTTFLEVSSHPVLAVGIQQVIDELDSTAGTLGTLRRDDGGIDRFATALAQAHVSGLPVDWTPLLPAGAEAVDLPTYAFQRERYWLDGKAAADPTALGLGTANHALLGATVTVAAGGTLQTGLLSVRHQPWLSEHRRDDAIELPPAAFVELAVRAGEEVDCHRLDTLTVGAPLRLTEHGSVQLQVSVTAPDERGRCTVRIFSQTVGAPADEPWTEHATGTLSPGTLAAEASSSPESWPPDGAEPVDVAELYEQLAAAGTDVEPDARAVRAAWRKDGEHYAVLARPDGDKGGAERFVLHPALLDAALHDPAALRGAAPATEWRGVTVHASGATELRARLCPTDRDPDAFHLELFDEAGRTVLTAESVTLGSPQERRTDTVAVHDRALFAVSWPQLGEEADETVDTWAVVGPDPLRLAESLGESATAFPDLDALFEHVDQDGSATTTTTVTETGIAPEAVVVQFAPSDATAPVAESVHDSAAAALTLLHQWLDAPALGDTLLVLVTRGAVATGHGDTITDPAHAALSGLVRSAQAEHPGRILLVDVDVDVDVDADADAGVVEVDGFARAVATAVSAQENQIALRDGAVRAPRLVRAEHPADTPRAALPEQDTVLITGGTGTLGGLLARHVVQAFGARRVVLTSRRGRDAEGAAELEAQLVELGADVTIAACDVSDREQLAALLTDLPEPDRLTGVIHAAGVLDDGLITSLTPERLARVLRPKVDAAAHLDELTQRHDLSLFALFSSAAGLLGGGGQGNYAAANAYLDALAEQRRARGQAGTSLAWGYWAEATGLTAHLDEADLQRMARSGVTAMDNRYGLDLFDRAHGLDHGVLLAARLDLGRLREQATATGVAPLFRALVRGRVGRGAESSAWLRRLRPLPPAERERTVLDLVRQHAATVLGHASAQSIEADRAFQEVGFDSLTAVELRNRLSSVTGLRLPASLLFDYPSPHRVAGHLLTTMLGTGTLTAGTPQRSGTTGSATGSATNEPLAITSMACRFPGGVTSPEALWELIRSGGDAVAGFPDDRGWDITGMYSPDPDEPGKSYVRGGGFLYDAADFDAEFFGISPREALAMDPQQRLLLETSWEAFERAGIDPSSVRGDDTGVFMGVITSDYAVHWDQLPDTVAGYLGTGNMTSVASGRVAYTLGLEGPAITIDTACSSSLVALHLAVQSLRSGECTRALVGGAAVMPSPASFIEYSRQRGLAADGRCKAFSAAADGFGPAEGVGVLLVERLSDAVRNGRRVLAVVRGSAVNQDGASNGLTAPNGPSQQRVIRAALRDARLSAGEVDVVEAHGTGTKLGDPIEAQALLATYGQEREPDRPLWLGSLKSNIGHTAAAAGVGGVMKMVLGMRHGVLPKTLHIDEPSPHVDWASGDVELLTQAREWAREEGRPRRAGVSSFGISGTNAHVILEEAPTEQAPARPEDETDDGAGLLPVPLVVSGRGERGLRAVAGELGRFLESGSGPKLAGLAETLVSGRSVWDRRAVVVAGSVDEAVSGLKQIADGGLTAGSARSVGGVGFVFPGQGAQWVGMGRGLLDSSSVFAEVIEACEGVLSPLVDWSLREVLMGEGPDAGLDRVDVVQPVSFAVMVALARLWRVHGVEPSGVVGHSQGEIAAVCVAGGLSLADAARVVVARSKAIRQLSGRGAMASLRLSRSDAEAVVGSVAAGEVWVAAENGPNSVVVSGSPDGIADVIAHCTETGVSARKIAVDYASHSPHIDEVVDEVRSALGGIEARKSSLTVFSSVTGAPMATETLDVDYWIRNLREPVEFLTAVTSMLGEGFTHFVEVSAHPVLVPAVEDIFDHITDIEAVSDECGPVVWGSLRRDHGDRRQWCTALAQAFTNGLAVDWSPLLPGATAIPDLPTYPFQRQRYWLDTFYGRAPEASGTTDDVDASFWHLVEQEDLEALASTLSRDLPGEGEAVGRGPLAEVLPALASWRRRKREGAALDSWGYRVVWKPLRLPTDRPPLSGTWLLAVPAGLEDDPAVPFCERTLVEAGAQVHRITVDPAADRGELATELLAHRDATGVLSLLALADTTAPGYEVLPAGVAATLALVQAWADVRSEARLWSVTRSAVRTGPGDVDTNPVQAQGWGLGRVAALEHPETWGGLLDLPTELDEPTSRRLAQVLAATDHEDQVALRASGALARRLVRAPLTGEPVRNWQPDGTVLITGGTGGIGANVARWLARENAEHLLLISRSGPDAPGAEALEDELLTLGAKRVTIRSCDVSDRAALAALLDATCDEVPLRAVIHTAAVLEDGVLASLNPDQMDRVQRVKVGGALNLHAVTEGMDLTAFVLFSSTAATFGSPGLGNYAPSNAFLDAFAERRREQGLTATSIGWGTWAGGGMADGSVGDRARSHGLMEMDPEAATTALRQALDHDETYRVVIDLRWDRFTPIYVAERPSRLIEDVPEAREAMPTDGTGNDGAADDPAAVLRTKLADQTREEQLLTLQELVVREIAAVLGHQDNSAVEVNGAFRDLGFDSLTAVELRNRLKTATGLSLHSSMVFDYPTARALVDHLRSELAGAEPDAATRLRAELDRFESVLTAVPDADDEARTEVTGRLRALLSTWQSGTAALLPDGGDEDGDLDSATDSELFELLDGELGTS